MDELEITPQVRIPMSEIELTAIRSQGAGGQNVNKVASAIHLRFDVAGSPSLPTHAKDALRRSGDRRLSADGVLVIKSQRHRSQDRNRQDALLRLTTILQRALEKKKPRIPTRPGKAAKQKRLDEKGRRSAVKKQRGPVRDD